MVEDLYFAVGLVWSLGPNIKWNELFSGDEQTLTSKLPQTLVGAKIQQVASAGMGAHQRLVRFHKQGSGMPLLPGSFLGISLWGHEVEQGGAWCLQKGKGYILYKSHMYAAASAEAS